MSNCSDKGDFFTRLLHNIFNNCTSALCQLRQELNHGFKYLEISCEGVGRDASNLIQKVKAAQYVRDHPDEVCPAKWEEGDTTLAPSLDLVGKI